MHTKWPRSVPCPGFSMGWRDEMYEATGLLSYNKDPQKGCAGKEWEVTGQETYKLVVVTSYCYQALLSAHNLHAVQPMGVFTLTSPQAQMTVPCCRGAVAATSPGSF